MQHISIAEIISLIEAASDNEKNQICDYLNQENTLIKVTNVINSIAEINHDCPHCKSTNTRKFGKTLKGLQRYQCRDCMKTYNALTGSPLAHLHKREQWLNMAKALQARETLDQTAARCGTGHATAFRWRHRFLQASAHDMADNLDGIVEADETYFHRSHKGKNLVGSKPRKRGGRLKHHPGISSFLVGVVVAVDRAGGIVDGVLQDTSTASISNILKGKLSSTVKLCIDGGNALWSFAQQNKLSCAVMPQGKYVSEYEPCFHIQTVNSYHSHLKNWMRHFRGVATKYLQNYLGWFRRFKREQLDVPHFAWIESSVTFQCNSF